MSDVPAPALPPESAHPADPAAKSAPGGGGLFLVDGSGFIFRAYHALPPLNRPDGTPVNAVLGFTNMMMKLLADLKAEAVAVIFDSKRLNFRNDIYANYKANRPDPPEDLIPQFQLIRDAVDAFCVPCLELEGYEADDLIATYARLAAEQGRPVTIVSSDKDLMQLVRDGVRMMDPMKGKNIGPEEVFEKFGVAPDKVVDVQSLAGDSVDNVPGVPGIGVKTAAQLINEYGDLETLLSRAGEIKQQGRREKLIEFADQARISQKLVRLDDHVPVPVPVSDLQVREPDSEKLLSWLRFQGFRSVVARVEGELRRDGRLAEGTREEPSLMPGAPALGGAATMEARQDDIRARFNTRSYQPASAGAVAAAPIETKYELVRTLESLRGWIARAREAGTVAFDTETDNLLAMRARIVGFSLSVEPGQACYVPLRHRDPAAPAATEGGLDFGAAALLADQIPVDAALAEMKSLLEDPSVLKVGHNLKYDMCILAHHGIAVTPHDDTMLISYVQAGGAHGHGMDELAQLHLGHSCITYDQVTGTGKARVTFDRVPLEQALAYAAEDADITLRLHRLLKPRLSQAHATTIYETIERPLVPVVLAMEREGVLVDRAVLADMSRDFARRLVDLEGGIHKLAGHPFNVGSPKQLGDVLFDEMGLAGGKKGKTGAYSTDSSVLEPLAEQGHDIVQRVLDWRQLAKLKSTYTDSLQEQIDANTGRVHTNFALAATTTGRLSSNDPNLQNIPIRTEEGRKIRGAFVAPPGALLLSVDYSQIELRLVAEMAGIEALKEAFQRGTDIHALTASQVFNVPLEQMTSEIRRRAKAINFGIIYGISAFGLGRQLGIPSPDAGAFIKRYMEKYWQLGRFMEETKAKARETGYVETLFGRRCYIQGLTDKNPARRGFAERQAINAPIQGTAADIIKRAMVRLPSALAAAKLQAKMLLQVHDELLFEVPEPEVEATSALVRQVMEGAAKLSVPLVAEAGSGRSWAAAH